MAGAHSWFGGHIWLVVKRAFVPSQANVAIVRLWDLAQMCPFKQIIWLNWIWSNFMDLSQITLIYAPFHNFSCVAITWFFGGTFGLHLVVEGKKTF